ncbi:hypothetical protein Esi_0084_0038 [Ectocarpus siliculosus]|uniref:Uncharacterized protein n=1 Tax=Ectocarpus siliculosus TaxID=2880 RepID=D7G7K8_ECTSI|nr:hypothetical protein Esi_0084_0038 [Ectocarpus siliculosus]|eukprot:CBJ27747.1 hypothetical protein Esi_0084_0038 [Ectocarpus siliculosus]
MRLLPPTLSSDFAQGCREETCRLSTECATDVDVDAEPTLGGFKKRNASVSRDTFRDGRRVDSSRNLKLRRFCGIYQYL